MSREIGWYRNWLSVWCDWFPKRYQTVTGRRHWPPASTICVPTSQDHWELFSFSPVWGTLGDSSPSFCLAVLRRTITFPPGGLRRPDVLRLVRVDRRERMAKNVSRPVRLLARPGTGSTFSLTLLPARWTLLRQRLCHGGSARVRTPLIRKGKYDPCLNVFRPDYGSGGSANCLGGSYSVSEP